MKTAPGLAATALLMAAPVHAQATWSQSAAAAGELKHVGACLYAKYRSRAVGLINSAPGSADEVGSMAAVRDHFIDCLSSDAGAIRPDITELRGAVAEAAYRAEHPGDPDFAKLDHAPQPLPAAWTSRANADALMAAGFAQCVVASDPQAAANLVRTEPRSPEEKAVIHGLAPSLGPCVVKDATLQLDAGMLRALVSQALYRSVSAWQSASPVKKN